MAQGFLPGMGASFAIMARIEHAPLLDYNQAANHNYSTYNLLEGGFQRML